MSAPIGTMFKIKMGNAQVMDWLEKAYARNEENTDAGINTDRSKDST